MLLLSLVGCYVAAGVLAGRFHSGEVRIRATVTGVPAWLRQPPPVVKEADASFEASGAVESQ